MSDQSTWQHLCARNDIPEQDARGFDLPQKTGATSALLAVKKSGKIFIYRNVCPHVGTRLEWQEHQFLDYDRQFIHCANHGALFEISTGQCIAGPCNGDKLEPIPFKLEDEQIWIRV